MTPFVQNTASEAETIALGAAVGRLLRPGDVVALSGELGAGKTRFVRGVASGLGLDPRVVSSPTFVMINEYPDAHAGGSPATLVHVDAHRLSGPADLDSLGWDEALAGPTILVVEWAERLAPALGPDRLEVTIEHEAGSRRRITLSGGEHWSSRLASLAQAGAPLPRGADAATSPDPSAHRCPTCAGEVAQDAPSFPFCSARCRMADLGKWFSGDYMISRGIEERDLDELE